MEYFDRIEGLEAKDCYMNKKSCNGCVFQSGTHNGIECMQVFCTSERRTDARDVIFVKKPEKNIMTPAEALSKMIVLATQKHEGQFDKGGLPYILHPLKVAHYLKTDDLELMAIAVGHDILEDTDLTFHDLLEQGFSLRVVYGIVHMTRADNESYDDYKIRLMGNKDAMRVKMADLRHNSDIRRLKGVTEKDIKRMVKYHNFYLELKEALKNG